LRLSLKFQEYRRCTSVTTVIVNIVIYGLVLLTGASQCRGQVALVVQLMFTCCSHNQDKGKNSSCFSCRADSVNYTSWKHYVSRKRYCISPSHQNL